MLGTRSPRSHGSRRCGGSSAAFRAKRGNGRPTPRKGTLRASRPARKVAYKPSAAPRDVASRSSLLCVYLVRLVFAEGRSEWMRAGQPVAGDRELPVAGDAARGIPSARFHQTIQNQRLQRRSRRGQGSRRVIQPVRRQQTSARDVEHDNPRLRSLARCAVNGALPRRSARLAKRAQRSARRDKGNQPKDSVHTRSMNDARPERTILEFCLRPRISVSCRANQNRCRLIGKSRPASALSAAGSAVVTN